MFFKSTAHGYFLEDLASDLFNVVNEVFSFHILEQ